MVEFMTKEEAARKIYAHGLPQEREMKLIAVIDGKPGPTLLVKQDASTEYLITYLEQQLQGVFSAD